MEKLISAARWPVGAALGVLGFAGLATSAQDSAVFATTVLVGGLGGLIVGTVVRGVQERRPSVADVVTFVLAGIAVFAVLHAGSVVASGAISVAVALLLAWVVLTQALGRLQARPMLPLQRALDASGRLSELDLQGLCELWENLRASASAARSPVEAEQLALVRAGLLDELERRSPGGFAAWIARGAAGSPSRYVA